MFEWGGGINCQRYIYIHVMRIIIKIIIKIKKKSDEVGGSRTQNLKRKRVVQWVRVRGDVDTTIFIVRAPYANTCMTNCCYIRGGDLRGREFLLYFFFLLSNHPPNATALYCQRFTTQKRVIGTNQNKKLIEINRQLNIRFVCLNIFNGKRGKLRSGLALVF